MKSVVEKFREKYGAKDLKKYYSKFDVAVLPLASGSKEREVKWWICLSAFRFSLSTGGEPVVFSRPYQNLLDVKLHVEQFSEWLLMSRPPNCRSDRETA